MQPHSSRSIVHGLTRTRPSSIGRENVNENKAKNNLTCMNGPHLLDYLYWNWHRTSHPNHTKANVTNLFNSFPPTSWFDELFRSARLPKRTWCADCLVFISIRYSYFKGERGGCWKKEGKIINILSDSYGAFDSDRLQYRFFDM